MMIRRFGLAVLAMAIACGASSLRADIITYEANLSGPDESPPNASPGIGFAEVDFDNVAHTMRVQVTFSDLLGTTIAANIHSATSAPGAGTAIVATQTPSFVGFPLGVTSGTFDQTFNTLDDSFYNPAFETANGGTAAAAEAALLTGLNNGEAYLNIRTTVVPGGEIRGFFQSVPEPASLATLGIGSIGMLGYGWRRRGRAARAR